MRLTRSAVPYAATGVILAVLAAVIAGANHRVSQPGRHFAAAAGSPDAATSRDGLQRTIQAMERQLSAHPTDSASAVTLSDALMRQARVTGNAGLALRAEAALLRVLHDEPIDYEARRMLATVYLSEHRFRDAVRQAERARDERPRDDWNYGVIGDGHLELGEYDQAFAAFQQMIDLRPTAGAYARASYALELQGQVDRAIDAMTLSTNATAPGDVESLAWHHAMLGDLYRQIGKDEDAARQYAWASHLFPEHPFAQLGAARLAEARGDFGTAVSTYERMMQTTPTPDVAERLGDVYEQLGRHDEAQQQFALAETGWQVDVPQPALLARFLAEHSRRLNDAVALAEDAAAMRHDIFTDDALAWCYFKAGRLADAARAAAGAQRTGTHDRTILYHAAAIEEALGHHSAARKLAQRAIDGNPLFDLRLAPAARALAGSGGTD